MGTKAKYFMKNSKNQFTGYGRKISTKRKGPVKSVAAVCVVVTGILVLRAEASSTSSVGSLSAESGKVVFYGRDVDYIGGELDALQGEIDYSVVANIPEAGLVSASVEKLRGRIDSYGVISYDNGTVLIRGADLALLADRTDMLADAYAAVTCRALNGIGTYFDAEGNVNHEAQTAESIVLDSKRLAEGIRLSQSVEHTKAAAVTEDNLTAGTAAWVNGECIVGNGADNERAYRRGLEDGAAGSDGNVDIQYARHVHTDAAGNEYGDNTVLYQSTAPGGCFVAAGHVCDSSCLRSCTFEGSCYESTPAGTEGIYHNYYRHTHQCNQGIVESSDWQVKREGIYWYSRHDYCIYMKGDESYSDNVLSRTTYNFVDRVSGGKGTFQQFDGPDYIWWYDKYISGSLSTNISGAPINAWKIGCGKRTGQIESATVTVCKNREK